MRKLKKLTTIMGISAMTAMMPFSSYASEKIEDVTMEIESRIFAGESGADVDVIVDTEGCYVDSVSVTNEPDEWEEDDKPRLKIVLAADDDYTFSSGLGKDEVALDEEEGTVTSVSRSSRKLTVYVTLEAVGYGDDYDDDDYDLDVYDLIWDQGDGGRAYWDGTDYAKKYYVRLYRDGEAVSAEFSTENNYYDFSAYFTQGGDYTFRAMAARNADNTGSWRTSEIREVSDAEAAEIRSRGAKAAADAGVTEGAWLKDDVGYWWCNPNKTYPAATWKLINGTWYYFNQAGYRLENQWQLTDGKWYYCGANGAMLANAMTPDNYYVGADGAWVQ